MDRTTAVQWRGNTEYGRVWSVVTDPLEIGDAVDRVSVDLRAEDVDLLERFAAYRNALAVAQGVRLKRKWTRKAIAESMLAVQVDALRHQLAEMFAALGEMPPAKDLEAMAKYAKRVVAWDKKLGK